MAESSYMAEMDMTGNWSRKEVRIHEWEEDRINSTALECVFSYIDNTRDRSSISLVCKKWYMIDALTRKHVTVALCYSIKPSALARRFKRLESVKIKGKPRAAMFKLIPDNWGGYAEPWVREITLNCLCLRSVHLRRMIVTDEDLLKLAKVQGHMLQVLKLDKCSGFSTVGLEAVARLCRSLRVLFLDESNIEDYGGTWLHELALHNSSLEVLNFMATPLQEYDLADLETLVANCESLMSLKVSEMDIMKLSGVLHRTSALQELGGVLIGGTSEENGRSNDTLALPKTLTSIVGLLYEGDDEGDASVNSIVLPLASNLKRLDLQCAVLSVEGHCNLLRHCCDLDTLEVLNGIGDDGLEVVGSTCKNLRRLRVERGDREVQQGFVTQRGLKCVAEGCHQLEYLAVYISDVDSAAISAVGKGCPKLRDFRLVLLEEDSYLSDDPLDASVASLMQGCTELTRFALYLRPGLLTDRGMSQIGEFGHKLKWVLMGLLGESDMGLIMFADGCPNLERLEMRDCIFSEAGIASATGKLKSLNYIWVQGYKATETGRDLLAMKASCWNIEFIPEHAVSGDGEEEVPGDGNGDMDRQPVQFLAYRSLAGIRMDNPDTVICLE